MAKEDGANKAQGVGGGSNKKLIIIVVVVLFLAVAASVGVTWFLVAGGNNGGDKPEEGAGEEVTKAPAVYFDVKPPIIVTFDVGGRQRYMQASLTLMSRDEDVIKTVELHMPLIRNKLLNVFGGMSFEQLQTNEGRVQMQESSLSVINQVLLDQGQETPVDKVLYTNLVLQ
ncbi:flagellar basal body-associated FliL family protein [Hahella ganghwensis]|uniref:flagellar basal body-associated FliL family protein n=1 Tax=Hahella ganghwensis TaxID=286420 RepID=UPI000367F6A2|nr:flagellar basal body-associated FliL family protein [Hahella ganghwensis]